MNTEINSGKTRVNGWLWGLVLVAIVVAAYQPVWHAGFIWDDDDFLVDSRLIKAGNGLYQFWFTTAAPDYFPLTSTTLWLEWRLWGMNPMGYHLVNVLLHAFSSVLLWRLLTRLKIPGAWLAAALFALHPVNVESVAWITERKNTLAMVFYLLTLLGYLQFEDTRRRSWFWIAVGTFALALLSKTAVVTLPFVLLGIAWWRRGTIARCDILNAIPFFAVATIMGLVTIWFQSHRAIGLEADAVRIDSFWSRVAGAGWAVWFYLYKTVVPFNLSFVYPRWQINPANLLVYVPGILVAAALLVFWFRRNRWGKAGLGSFGYFVLLLLPVLGFLNIYFMRYSLVADHWQYFAIIGPLTLAAAGIAKLTGLENTGNPARRIPGVTCCAVLLLALGASTWDRAGIYENVETLWTDTLAKNPRCWLAHNNLGNALLQNGGLRQAIAHHQMALAIEPDNAGSHNNLGNALFQQGSVAEAMACYERALQLKPDDARTHSSLGIALLQLGQIDQAIDHFQHALRIKSDYAVAHNNLGNAFLRQGRLDDAIAHYEKALQINPDYAEAHNNLGNGLLQSGDVEKAIAHYQQAIVLRPDNAKACNNLGNALFQAGHVDEAILLFQKAVKLRPDYADAHYNLGNTSMQKGDAKEAIVHYRSALEVSPDYFPACKNLAYALVQNGNLDEGIVCLQRAQQLQPDSPELQNNLAWLLATAPSASMRNGVKAVELARQANQSTDGKDPFVLHTLAAAYAETGQFKDAVESARKAIELAKAAGHADLTEQLGSDLKLYEAERPFHQESP